MILTLLGLCHCHLQCEGLRCPKSVTGRADVSNPVAGGIRDPSPASRKASMALQSLHVTINLRDQMRLTQFHPECVNSAQCAPYKHHFDECVERVTRQQEDEDYKGPKEDCVEECKYSIGSASRQRIVIPRYPRIHQRINC